MLTALWLGQRILLLRSQPWFSRLADLRQASRRGDLRAPCCGAPLVLRWGELKRPHFAHLPEAECAFQATSEPESEEHEAGKVLLFEYCQAAFGPRARVILEHPLPALCQRPDVYVEPVSGPPLALEYQRSALTAAAAAGRTNGYRQAGIRPVWVLGENRLDQFTPDPADAARWSLAAPAVGFLQLDALAMAVGSPTPYDAPCWRLPQQEQLWLELKVDARVGSERATQAWYERPQVRAAGSLYFLDSGTELLSVFRAVHPVRGKQAVHGYWHRETVPLAPGSAILDAEGLHTASDVARRQTFAGRLAAVHPDVAHHRARERTEQATEYGEAAARTAAQRQELLAALAEPPPAEYTFTLADRWRQEAAWLQAQAERSPNPGELLLLAPATQERTQRERQRTLTEHRLWQRLVQRFGLNPTTLAYTVGVPLPNDAVISAPRALWQAYILYQAVAAQSLGPAFSLERLLRRLRRLFPEDAAVANAALRAGQGRLAGYDEVVATYLNLLARCGHLEVRGAGDSGLTFYSIRPGASMPALADRRARWRAWSLLLHPEVTVAATSISVSDPSAPAPVALVPMAPADRPTPAMLHRLARLAKRREVAVDCSGLTNSAVRELLHRLAHADPGE